MGVYEVFLRDDRGKDQSTFSLTDAGKFFTKSPTVLPVLQEGDIRVNINRRSQSLFPGYQAVMNELFRVIGESDTETIKDPVCNI